MLLISWDLCEELGICAGGRAGFMNMKSTVKMYAKFCALLSLISSQFCNVNTENQRTQAGGLKKNHGQNNFTQIIIYYGL